MVAGLPACRLRHSKALKRRLYRRIFFVVFDRSQRRNQTLIALAAFATGDRHTFHRCAEV